MNWSPHKIIKLTVTFLKRMYIRFNNNKFEIWIKEKLKNYIYIYIHSTCYYFIIKTCEIWSIQLNLNLKKENEKIKIKWKPTQIK